MTPLKFRCWLSNEKKMVESGGTPTMIASFFDYCASAIARDEGIVMQSTGLKDRSGKEIFEGDVLRWISWEQEGTHLPDIYVVSWHNAGFAWQCYRDGHPIENVEALKDTEDFEVIGNVWENPDLLPPS